MFEESIRKRIRVVKTDGHVKVGILIASDGKFITLLLEGGEKEYIAVDSVDSIKEVSV